MSRRVEQRCAAAQRSLRGAWFLLLSLGTSLLVSPAHAETQAERKQSAARMVEAALRLEIEGTPSPRQEMLEAALRKCENFPPAMWHLGHVQINNDWVPYKEAPLWAATHRPTLLYREVRDDYADNVTGQLELAQWCLKHGLEDQARCHLTRVVELDPENTVARGLLGHRREISGWKTAEELAREAESEEQYRAAFAKWRGRLEDIRKSLAHPVAAQREHALKRLAEIDDPAAVRVMEQVLSASGEKAALAVVEVLGGMTSHEAALSLARHAVLAPWESVRSAAKPKLKGRPLDQFVPAMLAEMRTPAMAQVLLFQQPSGELVYRHAIIRENQTAREVAISDIAFSAAGAGAEAEAVADIAARLANRQATTDAVNQAAEAMNERICGVLAAATGEINEATPEAWWQWWNDENEVFVEGEKPITGLYEQEEIVVGGDGGEPQTFDCLAAGTKVWTIRGLVSIEEIQRGDHVLSQDPDTGELAFKSVLRTTIRPAAPIYELRVGDEMIRASGGHPLWISGQGWTKAREILTGNGVHLADGVERVRAVSIGPDEQTYNLVVADFHTYFVGERLVLSHDNTVRQPTDAVVPGLIEP